MKEYEDNFINKFKKKDDISKLFIEKIKSLQEIDEQ